MKAGVNVKAGQYALYVHCQTTLVGDFKALYPNDFRYEGARALHFDARQAPPADALRHCIALALTYHRRKEPKL